jgi:plastocyanin
VRKWLAMLVACLLVGAAVGCGDDDDDGGGAADTATAPAETTTDQGAGGQAPTVTMKDIAFRPTELSVKKGTTVTWTNDESVAHDVQKSGGPGPDFSSGDKGGMQQGDTFEHTFDAAGTYDYVCSVHSDMAGFVIVE